MTRDVDRSGEPFWDGLESGEIRVPTCEDCGRTFFPPGPVCPACGAQSVGWEATDGAGALYSFTRQHRTAPGFDQPLVIGIVELDAGPRLLAPIDAAYDSLAVGDRVRLQPAEYDHEYDRGTQADRPFFVAEPLDGAP